MRKSSKKVRLTGALMVLAVLVGPLAAVQAKDLVIAGRLIDGVAAAPRS